MHRLCGVCPLQVLPPAGFAPCRFCPCLCGFCSLQVLPLLVRVLLPAGFALACAGFAPCRFCPCLCGFCSLQVLPLLVRVLLPAGFALACAGFASCRFCPCLCGVCLPAGFAPVGGTYYRIGVYPYRFNAVLMSRPCRGRIFKPHTILNYAPPTGAVEN